MSASNMLVMAPTGVSNSATSVTASSTAAVALPTNASRIWITCNELVHVIIGDASVAAAVVATCHPLQPDTDYVFDLNPSQTHIRMIAATTTGVVYIDRAA